MKRPQWLLAGIGVALLTGVWCWPSLSLAEKTSAHLWGVTACLGATLGALLLLAIACLFRARWGAATHVLLQTCALAMPAVAALTLPLLLTLPALIHAADLPPPQQAWFAPFPFALRGLGYLTIWVAAAETWRRQSARADGFDAAPMRRLSASLLPPLIITLTLASIDWLMSLAAPWQSTAFGVYLFAGMLAAATSVAILGAWLVQGTPLQVAPPHVRSLGRLLFTFNFFWAYVAVGQLLIILMADLPDEIAWYTARARGPEAVASVVLVAGHFAIPFVLLLFERIKRNLGALAMLAVATLGMHALDMHELIVPSLSESARPGFAALVALLGATAFTLAAMGVRWRQLTANPKGATP